MAIPSGYNEITVGQFQDIYKILSQPADTESDLTEREIQLIAAISGKTDTEINNMRVTDMRALSAKLTWVLDIDSMEKKPLKPFLILNGKRYEVLYNIDKITGGQFIDLTRFTRNPADNMANLHNIIACLCLPTQKTWVGRRTLPYNGDLHPAIAKAIQDSVMIADVYPMALFFSKLLSVSYQITANSSMSAIKKLEKRLKQKLTRSKSDGAGL